MAGHKIKSETGFAFLQYSDPQSQILTYKAIFWLKVKKPIFWPTKLDSDILAQCQSQRSMFSDPKKLDSDLQGYFLAQSKRAIYSDPKSQILTYKAVFWLYFLTHKFTFWSSRLYFDSKSKELYFLTHKFTLWSTSTRLYYDSKPRLYSDSYSRDLFSDPHSHVLT